jgi:hypothetical protein
MVALPSRPTRLAILEADILTPGIMAKYGSYGGVVTYLFERACASLDPPQPLHSQLAITNYNVVGDTASYPDLDSLDAILITGSRYSASHDDAWIKRLVSYTKSALNDVRIRVIGLCFGHQIIGRALGAKVEPNVRGWELSVVEHELMAEGRRLLNLENMVNAHATFNLAPAQRPPPFLYFSSLSTAGAIRPS